MINIVDATPELLQGYLRNARRIDLEEVEAASGKPLESHLPTLDLTRVKVLIDAKTKEVLGIGGEERLYGEVGSVWLLFTYAVEDRKIEFLRFSRRTLKDYLFKKYRYIINTVYKRNELHMSWLTWLGAKWVKETDQFSTFLLERKE